MANPQKENGYTKIANELLEVLCRTRLNGTQRRILDVVFRYTYGYQKKEHYISVSFIREALGLKTSSDTNIKRELSFLMRNNIIIETSKPKGVKPRNIAFNKDYSTWTRVLEGADSVPLEKSANLPPLEGADSVPLEGANLPPNKERKKKESVYRRAVIISYINEKCKDLTGENMTVEFQHDCEVRLSEGTEVELIYKALAVAVAKKSSDKCKYAIGILNNWAIDGIKTLDAYLERHEKPKTQQTNKFDERIARQKSIMDEVVAELEAKENNGRKTGYSNY